jgi:uncharacterized protein YdaU (DUF1376 family)
LAKKRKKKGKPPAFQLYAKDALTGMLTMTLEERGAYWTMLFQQWDRGFLPGDDDELIARLMMIPDGALAVSVWSRIKHKFENSNGEYRNRRMEIERRKQTLFRRKQRKNGALGGRPRKNPGVISGFPLAKPKPEPKKSSSSSSAICGSGTTPIPPSEKGVSRRRRHQNPDPWGQQERTARMNELIAKGMSRREAQRKAFAS